MTKKNIIRTSAKVASKASKALKSNNATKSSKSIAGSALVLDFGQIPSIFRHKIRPNKRNLH